MLVIIVALVGLALVARLGWWLLVSGQSETRSVHRHGDTMQALRTLPERLSSGELARPAAESGEYADRSGARPGLPGGSPHSSPAVSRPKGLSSWELEVPRDGVHRIGRSGPPIDQLPWPARVAARVMGLDHPPGERDSTVEANARLTGTTGLVLIVLLFLEGVTIPFIGRLVSWHILIGLMLVPPLAVKMASVLWRFSQYYLHEPRFRRAGPPHPMLRVLGPLVMISTIVLFGSGIVLWLVGPTDHAMFRLHQVSFVFWFIVIAAHVAAHLLRATHLAAADARDARGGRTVDARQRRRARGRRGLVVTSLVLGLLIGLAGRAVSSAWTGGRPDRPATHTVTRSASPSRSR